MNEVTGIEEKIKKIKNQLFTLENKKKDIIIKEQIKLSMSIVELTKSNQDFLKELIELLEKYKAKEIILNLEKYKNKEPER